MFVAKKGVFRGLVSPFHAKSMYPCSKTHSSPGFFFFGGILGQEV
jgi:hypothetical protein